MLTEKELEAAIEVIMSRLDEVNSFFITKVAQQIKKIGELGAVSINRLVIMAEMGADIIAINQRLAEATGLSINDLYRIYNAAMTEVYTDPRFGVMYAEGETAAHVRGAVKERLTQYTRSVAAQTANTMKNLSNTTAVLDTYRAAVDTAIAAVSSGMSDYTSSTREIIRSLGGGGIKVEYESGYRRRLDTAVRQNIVDGVNQIAQNGASIIGDELGYDAYEISAHLNCAADHEPVQGRVFLRAEFEKMQAGEDFTGAGGNPRRAGGKSYSGFARPIGEWNCGHIAVPFDTKSSVRRYTDAQLAQWAKQNEQGCEIDGRHYSIYEATALMRKIETEVRRSKDTANAAKIVGDTTLRQECQKKINSLSSKYSQVAKASGLPTKRERMTVTGFKAVKLKK